MDITEYLRIVDTLLLIKAGVKLIDNDNKLKNQLLDYIDTQIAEYTVRMEEIEKEMDEQYKRSIH
jgi:hypothetical protein